MPPWVGQALGDEFVEAQTPVQLAHQNETTIGGDARSLKIHLQRSVEESWNGWFCLSPIGCERPQRLRRIQTPMDIDDEADPPIRKRG